MVRGMVLCTARSVFRHPKPRSFVTLPSLEPVSLDEARILPYKSTSLYSLIADVDSYSEFLPYCQDSKVTRWSLPDTNGRRWPAEAKLRVGWGSFEETFTSKLFCVPDTVVEAIGNVEELPSGHNFEQYSPSFGLPSTPNNLFKILSTRWTVKPFLYTPPLRPLQTNMVTHLTGDQTEVHLMIKFQFSNPLYAALSKAVAPKVASIMIEAFQRRARELLDDA
jgi:coenzyme Q-binding protein COQ10